MKLNPFEIIINCAFHFQTADVQSTIIIRCLFLLFQQYYFGFGETEQDRKNREQYGTTNLHVTETLASSSGTT